MISLEFLMAGKAVFTVSNAQNKHYTFKVNTKPDSYNKGAYVSFISVLTGSNNESDYTYVGMLYNGRVKLTQASKYCNESLPVKVFNFAMQVLHGRELPDGYKIQHEGHCGRCGRTLTTPESLESGLGPICRGLV